MEKLKLNLNLTIRGITNKGFILGIKGLYFIKYNPFIVVVYYFKYFM